MKILYIITKSEFGGAQTYISQLTKHMKESGNEVAVMASPGGWLESKVDELGANFYPNPYLKNSFNPSEGYRAMKRIREVVIKFQPDLVHCHSSAAGFWGRLALRKAKGKPVVIFTAHGWAFTDGVPFLRKRVAILAEKLAARYCDKIICVSEYDRQIAIEHNIADVSKMVTINNGVELFTERNLKHEARNSKQIQGYKSEIENNTCNIIFVGRLDKQKDPESFVEAFGELSEPVQDMASVRIIGDGPKRKKIEAMIRERGLEEKINLLGALPREQVFEKLVEADIFTLISHYEGFPITILEAMSMGLPIIASNVGGVSEAVYPENGFLVDPVRKLQGNEDVAIQQIENALTKLIMDKGMRHRMGMSSRNRVEKKFSLEKMLQKTEEIYQSLTNV